MYRRWPPARALCLGLIWFNPDLVLSAEPSVWRRLFAAAIAAVAVWVVWGYAEKQQAQQAAQELAVERAKVATLQVELRDWQDGADDTEYRLVVGNDGPAVADNVEVVLRGVGPRPHDPEYRGTFPYRVPTALGDCGGRRINVDGEEVYRLLRISKDSLGFNQVWGADGWDVPTSLDSDERFSLYLRVSSANARAVDRLIVIRESNNRVTATLEPAESLTPP
jgi:hypothetical protein